MGHKKSKSASVEFYEGGSLATVQREKSLLLGQGGPGGIRGEITTFSTASRRRLLRLIASIRRDSSALFITLTYPDLFPHSPERWKRDLKVFATRLKRYNEKSAFVWRLELKSRKSGENEGKVAPHYHLLLYGLMEQDGFNIDEFRVWLSQAWFEVVGSNDERHLRAGTSCTVMESWRGSMAYASKYLGKKEGEFLKGVASGVGRHWGAYFRKDLPLAEKVVLKLTDKQAVKVIRLFRKFSGVRSRSYRSLTVFLDGSQWRENIEKYIQDN